MRENGRGGLLGLLILIATHTHYAGSYRHEKHEQNSEFSDWIK
jgi:hypothetical protein